MGDAMMKSESKIATSPHGPDGRGQKRVPANKVRSFSQNQGSRKGISNILYNNQSNIIQT